MTIDRAALKKLTDRYEKMGKVHEAIIAEGKKIKKERDLQLKVKSA